MFVSIAGTNNEVDEISIANVDGTNLIRISPSVEAKIATLPFFSHDGKSVIYAAGPFGLYKVNVDGSIKHEKICDLKNFIPPKLLVSPVADKILKIDRERYSSNPKFVLVDFEDMKNVTSKPIGAEIEIDNEADTMLLSWSSSGKFVYLFNKIDQNSSSIIKLDIESGEMIEIHKIAMDKPKETDENELWSDSE